MWGASCHQTGRSLGSALDSLGSQPGWQVPSCSPDQGRVMGTAILKTSLKGTETEVSADDF